MSVRPPRMPWGNFPDVLIHATESAVKQHPAYQAAKAGDGNAAIRLVNDTQSAEQTQKLLSVLAGHSPTLVSAHAFERGAVNAIPEIFADFLGQALGWPVDSDIYQANVVFHTGADGFSRLARQARFEGRVKHGTELESWWYERFAHTFDALTESEARYLARTEGYDTVRSRIAAAE